MADNHDGGRRFDGNGLAAPLDSDALAWVAERVSLLLQLDRTRHQIPTQVDMQALANIPAYVASVFQKANALTADLAPSQVYDLVNRRISEIQAQLYLMRLEMDNRFERDPAKIYEDPLVISAYGERLAASVSEPRIFSFEPSLIAYGWHQTETSGGSFWRWMRPGEVSVVCLPHLGRVDQTVEIYGSVLDRQQLQGFKVSIGDLAADIEVDPDKAKGFVARRRLSANQVPSANLLPIEFRMTDFRTPGTSDKRMLGACIVEFRCSPVAELQTVSAP